MDIARLIEGLKIGDERAASSLVNRFSSLIRREAHSRLKQLPCGSVADADDVCQTVFQRFFQLVAEDRCRLREVRPLARLLILLTRREVVNVWRRQHTLKRAGRGYRVLGSIEDLDEAVTHENTPSQQATYRELLQLCELRMSADEQRIARLRQHGLTWREIAATVGGSRESVRRKFQQTSRRLTAELDMK